MGPTGCGKTAIVEKWLEQHKEEIKEWNWFANCYPNVVKKMYDTDGNIISCKPWLFDSNTIEAINQPDAVFVIDHFDLTNKEARDQMLSLVRNREVFLYTGEKVKLEKGPMMIVAVAFDYAEFGYDDLSDEDKSAFENVIQLVY